MKVAVFGMGYVGITTAALLANYGHKVVGVDTDHWRLSVLNRGVLPFTEPHLKAIVRNTLASNALSFTENGDEAISNSDVSLICVGTPSYYDGDVDVTDVCAALETIGAALRDYARYHVVVIRSTVPPQKVGELVNVLERTSGKQFGQDFGLCTNPEFLREGHAVDDFRNPPMLLIGQQYPRDGGRVVELYHQIIAQVVITDMKTAMLVKYISNAWHALKVAFANEVGDIAENIGVSGREVMDIFARDEVLNISSAYLRPGEPFGGSCLPKDLAALQYIGAGVSKHLISSIAISNENHIRRIARSVIDKGVKSIFVVGLTFKPGVSDLRHSPFAQVIDTLLFYDLSVRIYDPDALYPDKYARFMVDKFRDGLDAECLLVFKPGLITSDEQLPRIVINGVAE